MTGMPDTPAPLLPHPGDISDVTRAVVDGSLPRPAWTHAAHLEVCWDAVRALGAGAALDWLRHTIRAYNARTGTVDGDHSGYHETLTRYFVGAVAAVAEREGPTLADVLSDAGCHRDAPGRYWSGPVLRSVAARRRWVPPDRAPLPWVAPGGG